jgi:hypothetical protein
MRFVAGVLVLLGAATAFSQPKGASREFEVVSLHVLPELTADERMSNPRSRLASLTPSELRMPYASMRDLLLRAFATTQVRLIAPDWITPLTTA